MSMRQRAADVEPMRMMLRPDASIDPVRLDQAFSIPKKIERLERQLQRLRATGMVWCNWHATCGHGQWRCYMEEDTGWWRIT